VARVSTRGSIESRLLWLLGSPRSGSTWLLQMLGEHRQVVPVNEPLIGWYLGPFLSDLPGWDASALTLENFSLRRVQQNKRDQFFCEEFRSTWLPHLRRMMRDRFLEQAVRYPAGAPISRSVIAIKEPNGSQSADILMAALPKSRLLFLLRDGRDVVDSELAANLKGSWVSAEFAGGGGITADARIAFVRQSAQKWLWRTEVVEAAFAAHVGRKLLLRYEDLLADTQTEMTALLEWLELEADPDVVRGLVEQHEFDQLPAELRGPDRFFRAASPGGWRDNLTPAECEAMDEVLGAKVRALGYA
jgi:hypothetical protein